jgi:hypothetical protein
MFSAGVFVPGKRRLTNKMLSDLRAAGTYEGRAREMGRRPSPGHDAFAAETEAIRLEVLAAWRRASPGKLAAGARYLVRVFVTGHGRFDADAWYLLGKAAVDGVAAANRMSDRRWLYEVQGRVSSGKGERYYSAWASPMEDDGRAGFWLQVCEVRL